MCEQVYRCVGDMRETRWWGGALVENLLFLMLKFGLKITFSFLGGKNKINFCVHQGPFLILDWSVKRLSSSWFLV